MKKPKMVREPVQVYLDAPHVERLDRLVERLDLTKSDVLRRGLDALERETLDPASDPMLRFILERQAELAAPGRRAAKHEGPRLEDPVADALGEEVDAQVKAWHRRHRSGRQRATRG